MLRKPLAKEHPAFMRHSKRGDAKGIGTPSTSRTTTRTPPKAFCQAMDSALWLVVVLSWFDELRQRVR